MMDGDGMVGQQKNKWATDQLNKYDMYTQADFNSRFSN